MNYYGSLVYGALTLIFLFVYALHKEDDVVLKHVLLVAAIAWVACYAGAIYEETKSIPAAVGMIVGTVVAVVLAAMGVILVVV